MSSLVAKLNAIKLKTANTLGVIIVVFAGSFLILICFKEIPDKNAPIVHFLGGGFFSLLTGVAYHFFNYNGKNKSDQSHLDISHYERRCQQCPDADSISEH